MHKKDAYGSIAKHYDFFVGRSMRGIRRDVVQMSTQNGPILDIGCGTGEQSVLLANDGRQVIGIDSSPAMLAQAEKRHLANTVFILGEGSSIPYPDNSFTAALLSFVLHETTPQKRNNLVREASRIVTQQGSIIIVEYEPVKDLWARFLSLGIRLVERLAGKRHYRNYRNWMHCGGLSGFCKQHKLHVLETRKHFSGNIVVARCSTTLSSD